MCTVYLKNFLNCIVLKYNNLIIKRMTLDNDDNNEYYNYGIQKEGSYVVNL